MFRFTRTAAAVAIAACTVAQAQIVDSTEFTYQGRLDLNGQPFDGNIDNIQFRLWDGLVGGNLIGGPISLSDVPANDGLFTVDLDFGAEALAGPAYLEISLLAGGQFGTTLSPRQLIRAAPKAIQASGAKVDEDRTVRLHRPPSGSRVIASQDTTTTFQDGSDIWQSFTATQSGTLDRVSFAVFREESGFPSVEFYAGEGVSGVLLASGGGGFLSGAVGEVGEYSTNSLGGEPIEAGQVYTVRLLWPEGLVGATGDSYALGRSSVASTIDLNFEIELEGEGTSRAFVEPDGTIRASAVQIASGGDATFGDLSIREGSPLVRFIADSSSFPEVRVEVDVLQPFSETVEAEWDVKFASDELSIVSDTPGLGVQRRLTFESDDLFTGINDSTPLGPLHVTGVDIGLASSSNALNATDLIVEDTDAVIGLFSDQGASYGSAVVLGELNSSRQLTNKWSMVRETVNAGNDLQFRFGSSANYAANPLLFEVRDTGDIWAQGQLFQNSSGKNKDNVEDIRGAVETLLSLRGVRYTWKDDGDADIGFIAEEMAEVLPEIVDFGEDGEAVGIDYGRVTALIVEAVKAQQRTIESQDRLLAELLRRVEELEAD